MLCVAYTINNLLLIFRVFTDFQVYGIFGDHWLRNRLWLMILSGLWTFVYSGYLHIISLELV